MKKIILASIFLIAIAGVIAWSFVKDSNSYSKPDFDTHLADSIILKPDPIHSKKAQAISAIINSGHYSKKSLDDAISKETFDTYIEALDGSKFYFLAEDIEKFKTYRTQLDDFLSQGNVNIAYDIYNKYQERFLNRMDKAIELIDKKYDFTKDEYRETDREKLPYANTLTELDEVWRKIIKSQLLSANLNGTELSEAKENLKKRYERLRKNALQTNSEDVFQTYINALTHAYDPHTSYFSPISSENFNMAMKKTFEGIGARLTLEDDYTTINEIMPGGPAFRSKELQAKDKIIGVAQGDRGVFEDVIGWRLDDVVQLIRGKKGSIVRLKILPAEGGENAKPEIVRLVRDKIKIEDQSATKKVFNHIKDGKTYKIGVIDVPSFYLDYEGYRKGDPNFASTSRDVERLVKELKKENIDGLVIDLRNNGGGSLQEAIQLTGLFIKSGPVVQVKSSNGEIERYDDEDKGKIAYAGPLTVLVNGFSASASEIFAGAIQDYNRGLVIGEQTYGKGTVQNPLNLDRFMKGEQRTGQLNLTLSKFYRITGSSTQKQGVVPDLILPSLYDQEEIGERSENTALLHDEIANTDFRKATDITKDLISKINKSYKKRLKTDDNLKELVGNIQDLRNFRNRTKISLNEDKRRKELDEFEKKKQEREKWQQQKNDAEKEVKEDTKDPYIKNALEVMSEMILLKKS